MDKMYWYIKVVNQYNDFYGRASRQEFWMYNLISFLFSCVAMAIDISTGSKTMIGPFAIGFASLVYGIFVLIPGIAVSVRRLHDVGKSGWFILAAIVPIVGPIFLLILYCLDSKEGTNKWGPNPKEEQ